MKTASKIEAIFGLQYPIKVDLIIAVGRIEIKLL